MRRRFTYAKSIGSVPCAMPDGGVAHLPVIPGILKHPRANDLPALLARPEVAIKYTQSALSRCAWPVLHQFPRSWLRANLASAPMPAGRRRALEYLLTDS